MIAALYVETNGVYYGLPDVDPWDEDRDARLYAGPWPVVAHPPCAAWSMMGRCRPETRARGDGGTFAAALESVRSFGGVLEQPRYSDAWRAFDLPRPSLLGWTQALTDVGYTTEVDQGAYGFPRHKPTWLYYVGPEPPALRWWTSDQPRGRRLGVGGNMGGGGHQQARSATPPAFRDVLLDMARSAAKVSV